MSALTNTFPNYVFTASAHNTKAGGVVTVYPASLKQDYIVTNKVIDKGYILSSSFRHKYSNNNITVINTYLQANSDQAWDDQITKLRRSNIQGSTVIIGDMNHAQDKRDRSGYHRDKPNYCVSNFNELLKKHDFEEIYQKFHTCYSSDEERLISSRIDLAFHNFTTDQLVNCYPKATVITTAPHTVSRHDHSSNVSDWKDIAHCDEIIDRQLVDKVTTNDKGGDQVTDHLPLSIRFTNQVDKVKRKFASSALRSKSFKDSFKEIWYGNSNGEHWHTDLVDVGKSLCNASYLTKKSPDVPKSKNAVLWDAIRLINDLDEGGVDVHTKYEHIPNYLKLADDPTKLIKEVNKGFAAEAYDDNNRVPISRLQTIAKTLPSTKTKLNQLYDSSSDSITDDPTDMTKIAADFWRHKWDAKVIKDPKTLFKTYGKKISIQPTKITLDLVIDIINSTDNSAPGPDGIPFAAYRAVAEDVAPIFLTAIQALMRGENPSSNFNAGILHLLPKKATDRIEDTRPLVINNTNNRIIASVIQASIQPSIESILSNKQNGFREKRTTIDNIDYLNKRFYEAMENKKFCDILFVDFLKAFDSIAHEAIFELLKEVGFSSDYQNVIKALFHKAHCYTNFKNTHPEKIFFNSGVKQGCPLSPTLFILVADVLLDMLDDIEGVEPRMFADDTAVVSDNIIPCLPAIKAVFSTFKHYTGLEMNVAKSAIIATGGRKSLRSALDRTGWGMLRISGNERYLGTYMGHEVTLDDIFRHPMDKLRDRLKHYDKIKHKHSLQNRVIIWNTWLLTIFNYVFHFYIIPEDYVDWIDKLCVQWLNKGNTMKTLYLSRPTKFAGLTTPLRDTVLANYATLANRAKEYVDYNKYTIWTLNMAAHRARVKDYIQTEYNVDGAKCTSSADYYSKMNTSNTQHQIYKNEIKRKLNMIDIHHDSHTHYLQNATKAPAWLPSYTRLTIISIAHNALFTARRLRKDDVCHLCGKDTDDIKHIWGSCTTAKCAHNKFWSMLGVHRHFSLKTAICAGGPCTKEVVGVQYMLTDSIWRARNSAYHGQTKNTSAGWESWIVDNALMRLKASYSNIFINNFPGNSVPNRMKITFNSNLGSSSNNNKDTRETASHVVNSLISNLPTGSVYAFTDGSADPNPGPTGAGVAIFKKNYHEDTHIASLTAALGHGNNNTGELFAVGIALDYFRTINTNQNFHIFTDSNIVRGAMEEGWGVGSTNTSLLHAVRRARRTITTNTITTNWIPGHSGVAQNDLADTFAGIGSVKAADFPDFNIDYNCEDFNFLSFTFNPNTHRNNHPNSTSTTSSHNVDSCYSSP